MHSGKKAFLVYTIGFLLSAALTLGAYVAVSNHLGGGKVVLSLIVGALAVLQAVVQLVFFLHLAQEKRPRWNLITMLFMLFVLLIIVTGSIWIMDSLNYNMMPSSDEMMKYMLEQNKKGF